MNFYTYETGFQSIKAMKLDHKGGVIIPNYLIVNERLEAGSRSGDGSVFRADSNLVQISKELDVAGNVNIDDTLDVGKDVFGNTPQENGHIESFHSILGRSLDPKIFMTISDLEKHLENFYTICNSIRLHGSLDHLSPELFCKLWEKDLINRIDLGNHRYKLKLTIPHYLISGNGDLRKYPAF